MAPEPHIDRSITLDLLGDWGQATFHGTLSWLTQQFHHRAGPRSRTRIWSIRGAGVEAIPLVHDGEADLCLVTPVKLMPAALKGKGIFVPHGLMTLLKALAALPQRDRIFLAVHPNLGVRSFEDLPNKRPALTVSISDDDGATFIGRAASKLLAAHGVDEQNCKAGVENSSVSSVHKNAFTPRWTEGRVAVRAESVSAKTDSV